MISAIDVAPPVLIGLLLFLVNHLDVYYPALLHVARPSLHFLQRSGGSFDFFVALVLHYRVSCVC
jgi:hypothetical protein